MGKQSHWSVPSFTSDFHVIRKLYPQNCNPLLLLQVILQLNSSFGTDTKKTKI